MIVPTQNRGHVKIHLEDYVDRRGIIVLSRPRSPPKPAGDIAAMSTATTCSSAASAIPQTTTLCQHCLQSTPERRPRLSKTTTATTSGSATVPRSKPHRFVCRSQAQPYHFSGWQPSPTEVQLLVTVPTQTPKQEHFYFCNYRICFR